MKLPGLATLFAPLLAHQWNQQGAMQRAMVAQAQGLDPTTFGSPYPGSTVNTTNNQSSKGWLPGLLLGAGLLTAGTVGGVLGLNLIGGKPMTQTTPPPVVTSGVGQTAKSAVAPSATPTQAWDAIIEQQQPDGSWKQLRREHLQPKE